MIYQTLAKVFLICSSSATKYLLSKVVFTAIATRIEQGSGMMDGTQASRLRALLLAAADAIDQANAIVSALDSDDRALLSASLDEISSAVHFELLQKLYLRYPGPAKDGEDWNGAKT
jgi:hypothetical protein